jgi:hypothetical protein
VSPNWKMEELGPVALLEVPEWGTVMAAWLNESRCQVRAWSDEDKPETGVVRYGAKLLTVRQQLFAGVGWLQERGARNRTVNEEGKPLAAAAQEKLNEAVSQAVSDFITANPEVLVEAQRHYLKRELERAWATVLSARRSLALAESNRRVLAERLERLPEPEPTP